MISHHRRSATSWKAEAVQIVGCSVRPGGRRQSLMESSAISRSGVHLPPNPRFVSAADHGNELSRTRDTMELVRRIAKKISPSSLSNDMQV
jgi:hypothetical protein